MCHKARWGHITGKTFRIVVDIVIAGGTPRLQTLRPIRAWSQVAFHGADLENLLGIGAQTRRVAEGLGRFEYQY